MQIYKQTPVFMCNAVLRQCFILTELCIITLCLLERGNIVDDPRVCYAVISMFPRFVESPKGFWPSARSFVLGTHDSLNETSLYFKNFYEKKRHSHVFGAVS